MKALLPTIGTVLLLTTAVAAQEATPSPVKDENVVDCTKQVWPDFSPACLRNTDKAITVRLVTPARR